MNRKVLSTLGLGFVLSAAPALAHVEKGIYKGVTPEGAACELSSAGTYFLDGAAHPINERVDAEFGGQKFTLRHPPVISVDDSTAAFNHDTFQGIAATPVGAKALVIFMDHTAGADGPTGFVVIDHAWKANQRTKFECTALKLEE